MSVDLDAVDNDSLGLGLVVEGLGNGSHLSRGQLKVVSIVYHCMRRGQQSLSTMGATISATYGEVWGRGPCGLAVDIADEGLVDVASADEAVAR